MSTERQPNPSENEVEGDFSVPEDADFTTPGDPLKDDEHAGDKSGYGSTKNDATPGNPIGE
ncbi:hypothetical protein ACFSBZ_00400 [Amnibacterium flavum]|uniref:Uncharacterized protein n=1 Tax=Amnibacterium flavum TaxID=2173173 RepID=A0A2V1HRL7_9MICO|nr:hypothetical protein [Amnibacterium flavum]PVZ93610.1 hypothetical protein DDQ50_14990 [Amnibacterium flavum]